MESSTIQLAAAWAALGWGDNWNNPNAVDAPLDTEIELQQKSEGRKGSKFANSKSVDVPEKCHSRGETHAWSDLNVFLTPRDFFFPWLRLMAHIYCQM